MTKKISFIMILFLVFSLVGCTSMQKTNQSMIILPAEPLRRTLEVEGPYDVKDYMTIIIYQDNLISEWEVWADEVQKTVDTLNEIGE